MIYLGLIVIHHLVTHLSLRTSETYPEDIVEDVDVVDGDGAVEGDRDHLRNLRDLKVV